MFRKSLTAFFLICIISCITMAQEIEVDRYNITANIDAAASAMDVRASIVISNLAQSAKSKLFFRLTRLAKVGSATVNGANAPFESTEDRRVTTINQISITPQAPVGPGAKATVEISYRLESPESNPLASIYPGEVLMTPESVWVPMPSTMFTLYGATSAPFSLTVSAAPGIPAFRVASSGGSKGDAGGQSFSFDESLNCIPFFVAGSFDQALGVEHGGVKIEVYVQPGLNAVSPDARENGAGSGQNLRRLADEAGRIIDFYSKALGPPSAGRTFRIISSVRSGNLTVPGAVVFNEKIFRQDVLEAATIEMLADAVARMWLDGRVKIRGQEARAAQADRPGQKPRSPALLRDSLPRYLAGLYFEERFGEDGARQMFSRFRWAYTPVAQSGRDAELGLQTVLLPTYSAAVFSKGPLVLRLIAETTGRERFIGALRTLFSGDQTRIVTNEDFRQALVKAAGPEVDKLFQQWIDSIVEPDLVVGAPLPADAGAQRVNVRNLGTGDVTVTVTGMTVAGKQVSSTVTVPSENITSTDLKTSEKIVSVEVDPLKLIIQTNYDNDSILVDKRQRKSSSQTLFNESIAAFNKGEFAQAESKLRDAVGEDPRNSLLHAWLARALAAQSKNDEAVSEANAALKVAPPAGPALAWAHITIGQVALAKNQAGEAVVHLRRAVAEADEAPAQFASRELLIRAERSPSSSTTADESLRSFFAQLDSAIKQPTSDRLYTLITKNNLKRFVQGLTVTPPSSWSTEVLRIDQVDANRVSVDVGLKVKAGGRDQSGTAVFGLRRSGSGWMLEEVNLFNVK
jgi:hypothetical protein